MDREWESRSRVAWVGRLFRYPNLHTHATKQVMTQGGPWKARRLAQGDQVMSDLEQRFLAKIRTSADAVGKEETTRAEPPREGEGSGTGSGGGNGVSEPRRLEHQPFARVIVIRRNERCRDDARPASGPLGSEQQSKPVRDGGEGHGEAPRRGEGEGGCGGGGATAVPAAFRRPPQSAL